MKNNIVEKIGVPEGVLIINRQYMVLQTPDGVLHPADLDAYGQYQPILELIRLISDNADLSENITQETKVVLRQALLGDHPLLSHLLVGTHEDRNERMRILEVMNPQTKADFVRVLCLIYSSGLYSYDEDDYPFVCREELRDLLCFYLDEDKVFELSEAVRKGKFACRLEEYKYPWEYYREELMLLPGDVVDMFSRIKYLPRKSVFERIVHYAIIAANSLIKNKDSVILAVDP